MAHERTDRASVPLLTCAVAMLVGGCSGNAAVGEAGDSGVILYRLGTGRYVVTSEIRGQPDDCMPRGTLVGALYDLEIDNNSGRASITEDSPTAGCLASLGCGTINDNAGTLVVAVNSEESTCSMRKAVESSLRLMGDGLFTLAVVQRETMRLNCVPAVDACTATFTLTLARYSPDAG